MRALLSVLLMFTALLSGCHSLPDTTAIPVAGTNQTIWLIYRDWHTSILIEGSTFWRASKAVHAHPQLESEASSARYVRVGWGDGAYFTGKSTNAGTATRALFASNYSALQIIGYEQDPFDTIPATTRVPLQLTEAGIAELIAYIDTSFARDPAHGLKPLPSYVDNSGVFFEADQHYGLFNNCNTWSGAGLQAAGLPIRSALQLTAKSIFDQASYISAYQQAQLSGG